MSGSEHKKESKANAVRGTARRFMKLLPIVSIALLAGAAVSMMAGQGSPSEITQSNEKNLEKVPHIARSASAQRLRFPKYGSAEFASQCPWAIAQANKQDCSFFVRPLRTEFEGISKWMTQITTAFMLAQQANCRLLLDYGLKVDVSQVLQPLDATHNWSVPVSFECSKANKCYTANYQSFALVNRSLGALREALGRPLAMIPWYRSVYSRDLKSTDPIDKTAFQDLPHVLSGFRFETGMACSINSLFDLSQSASQFEPHLFANLIPTLRDPTSLVLMLYIRTGLTDMPDWSFGGAAEAEKTQRGIAQRYLDCALKLEKQHHSDVSSPRRSIVWMVISDSPYVKQWISETYSNTSRTILTTSSRGKHTRFKKKPSTQDFAEGLLDWYLIGESNVVILEEYSFGMTGSLRTSRPVYDATTCTRSSMFRQQAK